MMECCGGERNTRWDVCLLYLTGIRDILQEKDTCEGRTARDIREDVSWVDIRTSVKTSVDLGEKPRPRVSPSVGENKQLHSRLEKPPMNWLQSLCFNSL